MGFQIADFRFKISGGLEVMRHSTKIIYLKSNIEYLFEGVAFPLGLGDNAQNAGGGLGGGFIVAIGEVSGVAEKGKGEAAGAVEIAELLPIVEEGTGLGGEADEIDQAGQGAGHGMPVVGGNAVARGRDAVKDG